MLSSNATATAQAAMLHNHEIDRTIQLPVELFSKPACHEGMHHRSSWIHQRKAEARRGHHLVSRQVVSKQSQSGTYRMR
jgi:hypothetical protein